jgi:carbon-monoxide dehydrogenase large subunit
MSTTLETTDTWVGRSIPRKEDAPLVTGSGQYVPDMALPGTLEVAFMRSPLPHARIRAIDVSRAKAAPGVVAVFTWDDIKDRVSHLVLDQESASPALESAVHPRIQPAIIEILAEGEVRFVGQAVAAVVAASRYQAEDAVELIDVDYEELPAVTDPARAQDADAPQVIPSIAGNLQATYHVHVGDPDGAFARAPHTLKMRIRTQRIAAAAMETRGVLAQCIGEQITLWSSTQIPHLVRNHVAARIGVPEWQVRVIAPHVGGGFGSKVQVYAEEVLLAHIARVVRKPVRWVEDRQENLVSTGHARDQIHDVEAAFEGDGTILAVRDRFLLDAGICCPWPLSSAYNVSSHFRSMYAIRNFDITSECVLTHKMFNLPYRGAGRPEAAFVMDRLINQVARELDLDPADVIRRNLIQDSEQPWHGGMPYRDGSDVLYDAVGFPAAFEKTLELVDYESHKRRQPDPDGAGVRRGIGFGTYVEGTGVGPFESAQVQIDSQGNVVVYAGCSPHGQGLETTLSQVVADLFGIPPENVIFRAGDTALLPYGVGTFASRSVITAGAAIHVAARRLQERLKTVAGEILEIQPDDLEVAGGEVRARGVPARSISLRDLYRAAAPGPRSRVPQGMDPGSAESYYFVPPTVTWGFGVVAAVVDVDVETGAVSLRKLAIVHDCGRVINPVIVEGQVEGGLMQGVGATLYEEIVYEGGQPRATSFMDYLLPTSAEVPEIVQEHMEVPSDRNPLGVKGIGEAGTISPPGAIANAVIDALRPLKLQLNELPLSPPAVTAAIDAAKQG